MSEIRVFVGPKQIDGADRSAHNNPIARAIRARLGKPWSIPIHTWHGVARIGGKTYALPKAANDADVEFSSKGTIAPFAFQLSNEEVEVKPYGKGT